MYSILQHHWPKLTQKENEEPQYHAAADIAVDIPEAPPIFPTVHPCDSTEYEESVTPLQNMIRNAFAD